MLPLWIIDITDDKSINRRDEIIRLVGKIANTRILDTDAENEMHQDEDISIQTNHNTQVQTQNVFSEHGNSAHSAINEISDDEEDDLDIEDIHAIDRNRIRKELRITGNYWYYTHFVNIFNVVEDAMPGTAETEIEAADAMSETAETENAVDNAKSKTETEKYAKILYEFQTKLIQTGKRVIEGLRESSVKPYEVINIVVLGDVREQFSQMIFPSLATILQKEKGRILPHHIHQGMEMVGMLYIPCDINTYDVAEREKVLLTLKEIELQHKLTSMRGYDHMLLFQNVQNRTENTYPKLTDKQQAEYVIQCLINLYFACDRTHPLFRGTASADNFYMTIGAASLHFDMTSEDERDNFNVANTILDAFKEEGEGENVNNIGLLNDRNINPDIFIDAFDNKLDMDIDLPSPYPHPIYDYTHKYLKRSYYHNYLRYFPVTLKHVLTEHVADASRIGLQKIAAKCKSTYGDLEREIYSRIDSHLIQKITHNEGGLSFIESQFKELQDKASRLKNGIQIQLEERFWQKGIIGIPAKLRQSYDNYHEAYRDDVKRKNNGRQCEEAKREAEERLINHLKQEATTLSRIAHATMLGIILAIAVVPILSMLSPWVIDLGHVKRNYYWWALLVFLIPVISELISYYLYTRKKNAFINTLKAYYLHDAYARIANRIEFETGEFYNKLIRLSEEYIRRCKAIRTEVFVEGDDSSDVLPFPETMFNQPLCGGEFNGEVIIPPNELEKRFINVNYIPKDISELKKEDYFILLHTLHCEFRKLFSGVMIHPPYERKKKEDGTYEFFTKEMLEEEDQKKWEDIKSQFSDNIKIAVGKEMRLRENPTVGEAILYYFNSGKNRRRDILEPIMNYAATNGEVTSEYDTEFADIKCNKEGIIRLVEDYLPNGGRTNYQIEKSEEYTFFTKFFFVTRWRSFEHFSFNRILPREDFDKEIRKNRIWTKEEEKTEENKQEEKKVYKPIHSSLILWAVCPDKSSPDWFTLFDSKTINDALEYREIYRKYLNPKD